MPVLCIRMALHRFWTLMELSIFRGQARMSMARSLMNVSLSARCLATLFKWSCFSFPRVPCRSENLWTQSCQYLITWARTVDKKTLWPSLAVTREDSQHSVPKTSSAPKLSSSPSRRVARSRGSGIPDGCVGVGRTGGGRRPPPDKDELPSVLHLAGPEAVVALAASAASFARD